MKCEHKRNGTSELCSAPSNILYEQNNLGIRDSEKKSSKKMGMCPQGACEIDPKRAFKKKGLGDVHARVHGRVHGSMELVRKRPRRVHKKNEFLYI